VPLKDPRTGIILFAASIERLNDEDLSVAVLCGNLNLTTPPTWPPQFNDRDTRDWFRSELLNDPDMENWLSYYVSVPTVRGQMLVGAAGYKGKPSPAGAVEIGYTIIPEFQGMGIATAASKLLIANAFSNACVKKVTAETLPSLEGSIAVLRKCGFSLTGQRKDTDSGVILQYELSKSGGST
jgi:[ribosomal protein S5]-alanine N-acetyltransferase